MKKLVFIYFCVCILILSSCTSDAPSNKALQEIIYGTYLQEAVIVRKEACEKVDRFGDSSVWLIRFRYKGDSDAYGYLIEKKPDGTLIPIGMPSSSATCPK